MTRGERYTRMKTVELRRSVVAAKAASPALTYRQLAAMFNIGKSSVDRYLRGTHCPSCGRPFGTNKGQLAGTNEGQDNELQPEDFGVTNDEWEWVNRHE